MKKVRRMLVTAAVALSMFVTTASAANGIADSDLGRGFTRLLQDAMLFVAAAGVTISIIAAMLFWLARGAAEPQDAPMWNKRIKGALIAAVAIPLVSAIVALIASYF